MDYPRARPNYYEQAQPTRSSLSSHIAIGENDEDLDDMEFERAARLLENSIRSVPIGNSVIVDRGLRRSDPRYFSADSSCTQKVNPARSWPLQGPPNDSTPRSFKVESPVHSVINQSFFRNLDSMLNEDSASDASFRNIDCKVQDTPGSVRKHHATCNIASPERSPVPQASQSVGGCETAEGIESLSFQNLKVRSIPLSAASNTATHDASGARDDKREKSGNKISSFPLYSTILEAEPRGGFESPSVSPERGSCSRRARSVHAASDTEAVATALRPAASVEASEGVVADEAGKATRETTTGREAIPGFETTESAGPLPSAPPPPPPTAQYTFGDAAFGRGAGGGGSENRGMGRTPEPPLCDVRERGNEIWFDADLERGLEAFAGLLGVQLVFIFFSFVFGDMAGASLGLFAFGCGLYCHVDHRASSFVVAAAAFLINAVVLLCAVCGPVSGFERYQENWVLRGICVGQIPTDVVTAIGCVYLGNSVRKFVGGEGEEGTSKRTRSRADVRDMRVHSSNNNIVHEARHDNHRHRHHHHVHDGAAQNLTDSTSNGYPHNLTRSSDGGLHQVNGQLAGRSENDDGVNSTSIEGRWRNTLPFFGMPPRPPEVFKQSRARAPGRGGRKSRHFDEATLARDGRRRRKGRQRTRNREGGG